MAVPDDDMLLSRQLASLDALDARTRGVGNAVPPGSVEAARERIRLRRREVEVLTSRWQVALRHLDELNSGDVARLVEELIVAREELAGDTAFLHVATRGRAETAD